MKSIGLFYIPSPKYRMCLRSCPTFRDVTLIGLPTVVVTFTCEMSSNCTLVSRLSSPGNKCRNPPFSVKSLRNWKNSLPAFCDLG